MRSKFSAYIQVFRNRRIAVMALLGFSSGLPLPLTLGTLQAWMAVAGVELHTIGLFSLVGVPYTVKFLWSPFMDRFVPPWLGRRRGWILPLQIGLLILIALLGAGSPRNAPWTFAALALMVAFVSASQDIVVDAYRTDVLQEVERGIGAAVFITGYRIAMIVSGAVALKLVETTGWQNIYLIMAGLMTIGIVATLSGPEPEFSVVPPRSLKEAVWGPLKDFFSRRSAVVIMFLIILYKLCDAYAGTMTTAFLIRGAGFSTGDVGTVNKGLGLVSLIVGATLGGTMMVRLGLFRSLLIFGVMQALSILSFIPLVWAGKSYPLMVFAVALENLTGGMGTAAFVSFLMALCNHRYTATQFALLSSLASLGRVFIAPTSGYVVESAGWANFFIIAALTALPGLLLLWRLRTDISALHKETT